MKEAEWFQRVEVDPITMQVLGGAFTAIAKEMAYTVIRTAYSQIVHDNEDIGSGIFDPEGNQICESHSTPMHIGSIPAYIRGFLTRLKPEEMREGDIIFHNHPYYGASHTPDAVIATPIFWQERLVGYAAINAHLVDVGEGFPVYVIDVPDVYGEARLYYGLKIYERGVKNEQLWRHILDNVRAPSLNEGDMYAMIAAVNKGKKRWLELLERYGLDAAMSAAYAWMDYSEAMLRKAILEIPDGTYYAEGYVDDDGRNRDVPIKICVTIRVEGSEIAVDLAGSHPEVMTATNVPFEGSTKVCIYYMLRTLLLDEAAIEEFIPQNQGMFRPIQIIAPRGSIFNPRFPRACHTRFASCMRLDDLIIKALAPAIPQRVTGGCTCAGLSGFSGFDPQKQEYWAMLLINAGAHGGYQGKDGLDAICPLFGNVPSMPLEELEFRYPIRCERWELRDDVPPAAGKWRGGLSPVYVYRFLSEGFIANMSDRQYEAPWGIFGGHAGAPRRTLLNPGTPREKALPSKVQAFEAGPGDVIAAYSETAGGYGDPYERDPQKVLDDYLDGYITLEIAARDYGVILDPATKSVDEKATREARSLRA